MHEDNLFAEQKQSRSRKQSGHAQNRQQGLPPPGIAPFGYKRTKDRYVINRANAPIVREFFEHFLLYGSLRGAVRHIAQKFNKVIAVSTGKHWLTNPVYRGDLSFQTVKPPVILRDTHKAIISRDEAAQVDRLLKRNKPLPPRTASAKRSLAGLVVCSICQGKMIVTSVTVKHQSKSYLYLRCLTCSQVPKCKAIDYELVLERIISKICTDLPQAVTANDMSGLVNFKARIEDAIADKQKLLAQLPSLVDTGILDMETLNLRSYNLRAEIANLESQKAQLPPTNLPNIAQTVSIPQFWWDLSESERRFYFREFLRIVQINPSHLNDSINLVFVF